MQMEGERARERERGGERKQNERQAGGTHAEHVHVVACAVAFTAIRVTNTVVMRSSRPSLVELLLSLSSPSLQAVAIAVVMEAAAA